MYLCINLNIHSLLVEIDEKRKKKVKCCVIDCCSPDDQSYRKFPYEKKYVNKWIEAYAVCMI